MTAENVNGVVVLIVMSPGHLQVFLGNQTQKKLFTQEDRKEMQPHLNYA